MRSCRVILHHAACPRFLLLTLWRHDERHHMLTSLEADTVARGSVLAGERSDPHPVPRTSIRDVGLDHVRLVTPCSKLGSKLLSLVLRSERAHLKLEATFLPRR